MILPDSEIMHRVINQSAVRNAGLQPIGIKPWNIDQLQPASYELTLGPRFMVFDPFIDLVDSLTTNPHMTEVDVSELETDSFTLHPGEFALGSSIEYVTFPNDIVGILNGKSSLGRLGLQVHSTSGFFDPGFHGTATLEMSNVSRFPIRLHPGMSVAQMVFVRTSAPAQRPYGSPGLGSRYQYQSGPTPMRVTDA